MRYLILPLILVILASCSTPPKPACPPCPDGQVCAQVCGRSTPLN